MKNYKLEIIEKLTEISQLLSDCEDLYFESELDSNFLANQVSNVKSMIFEDIENLSNQ